ncbi:hypothetical protein D8M33_01340 [Micrococcus sp. HSID17245]|uniref:hypothetical protein n=1 Tax=Micrococcus sp. HSID17245 TaxID=2419508 RepID=UPI000F87587D|nr:hypothetical protein [Micrococcus sp. HSID17245]RUQ34252.1 hypothetical protein D8M33_01340 [Micrococcus sp. HSID17245]
MATSSQPLSDIVEAGRPFTRGDLRAAGVSERLVRGGDARRVTHGVHRLRSDHLGSWAELGYAEAPAPFAPEETAAIVAASGGVASHLTALLLHRVPLPPFLAEDGTVHVSRPHPRGASVRPEITSHARLVPAADVTVLHGIRLTSLERSWADLAALVRPGMLEPAVAAGDVLVHRPWSPEGRRSPRTTTAALRSALLRAGRFKGVRTARAALELVRVGADSPQETALRLALVYAGLPEPELQLVLHPGRSRSPDADLGWRQWRLVVHYDGGHHLDPAQLTVDAWRDEGWARAGWTQIWVTVDDARDDFRRVVDEVQAHRARLGGRIFAS